MRIIPITALALLLAGHASGGTSDFESVPGQVPSEGLPSNNQFMVTHGVSFELEGGGSTLLAEVGVRVTAFQPPTDQPPLPPRGA